MGSLSPVYESEKEEMSLEASQRSADLVPVGMEMGYAITQFYYREARLFNQNNYREWLESMIDREIFYYLPIFEDRHRADRKPKPAFPPAIYQENYEDLDQRIQQMETNLSRRLDPPIRIRHLITNVEAFETDKLDEFDTLSNFLVCRNRREREETILVGGREDRIRKTADGFRIVKRTIRIPQRVILDADLYYMM